MSVLPLKDSLRTATRLAREALTAEQWDAEDTARLALWHDWLHGQPSGTLACYASRPGEPSTRELIDAASGDGWRVLLPVLRRRTNWAWFDGWADMRLGWAGIPEPTTPPLGAEALREASIIIVPCLALGRDGTRLGSGGGWYDRALHHRSQQSLVIALARSIEVVDKLPLEPHDLPVDLWLTEQGLGVPRP